MFTLSSLVRTGVKPLKVKLKIGGKVIEKTGEPKEGKVVHGKPPGKRAKRAPRKAAGKKVRHTGLPSHDVTLKALPR